MDLTAVRRFAREHPLPFWWGVALLIAILTGIVWPTIPSYDPFSWVVWGREVTDPHIPFLIGGGPSWKPLPFLFTTVYGLFGSAAPWLWVVTARAGGIAGLIGAFRLVQILCERTRLPWYAGVAGGIFAIGGIVLSYYASPWGYYFFRGTSEVLLIGVWLWAVERLIAGHHWQAYMLIVAEGLMRPEAWPFLFVYGAWLWFKHPSMRAWVVLGLVAQPVGWFGPPWISDGQPFLAATHAHDYNGDLGSDWLTTVLNRGETLQPLPTLGFAVVATVLALWRGRDRVVLSIAAATAAWWLVVVVETWRGYPGLQRFFLPGTAMTCVLAGLGIVWLAAVVAEFLVVDLGRLLMGESARLARVRAPIGVLVGIVMLAGSWHWATASTATVPSRWATLTAQKGLADMAVRHIDDLGTAIAELGGTEAILPCAKSKVTINHSLQTAFAWKLGTNLERVGTMLTAPGVAFVGPSDGVDGGPPPITFPHSEQFVRQVGVWRVYRVWRRGRAIPACVGLRDAVR